MAHDVAVVGAGHNGQICAAYLARAGLDVVLLEARGSVGGCASTVAALGARCLFVGVVGDDDAGRALDEKSAKAIEAASLKTVPAPSGGIYLGDWKEGEKIAQSGRGLTWTDNATDPNGGNCYNCHQISKAEVSFGTIGPSLYQYGKLRGVTDPASAQARVVVAYTWGKIWNARATSACSSMPRFGHNRIRGEQTIPGGMPRPGVPGAGAGPVGGA